MIKNLIVVFINLSLIFINAPANATLKAGVNKAIYNTNFKDSLKSNLATQATNIGFSYVGDYSQDQELNNNSYFSEGALGKVALHSLVGGIGAKLSGGEFKTGAISAGVRELISPLTKTQSNPTQLALSQLTGALAGAAINGNKGATTGYNISTSAEKYNRQLHEKEIEFIKKNAKAFTKQKGISEKEAQKLLYTSAMYYNNKSSKLWIDANQKEVGYPYSKQDIRKAFSFLQENSKDKTFIDVYKNNFRQQNYFTSTNEQYNDTSYRPDTSIGLKDESVDTLLFLKGLSGVFSAEGKYVPSKLNNSDKLTIERYGKQNHNIELHNDINNRKITLNLPKGYKKNKDGNIITPEGHVLTKGAFKTPSGRVYDHYGREIDLDLKIRNPRTGRWETNKERMQKGKNPYILDENGKPVPTEQHHLKQNADGPILELEKTKHKQNSKNLHPFKNGKNPNNPVNHEEWGKDRQHINKQRIDKGK